MKNLLIFVFFIFFGFGCMRVNSQHSTDRVEIQKKDFYKVYKVDSLNSYYLIYASGRDSLFKIVSKKELVKNCETIKIGKEYVFKLHSILSNRKIAGQDISPFALPHVSCYYFDDSTNICLERDSINDLHRGDNIKGLCFKER